jgi:hypothetical protein
MAISVSITAACIATALRDEVNKKREDASMTDVKVYAAEAGGWIYEVWIAKRPVVVGWCHTRVAAEQQASLV